MRCRFLTPLGSLVGVLLLVSVAAAGDYHSGITLMCSDCHVMHYSQSHGNNPNGSGTFTPLGGGPHHYLLRNTVNNLCLSCHDNQTSAPDVFESHSRLYPRQAGALNEEGGNALYPPPTGHTLNSTATAPGGDWSNPTGMTCADCHAVHGSNAVGQSSYRNLGGFGTKAGSSFVLTYSSGGTNDLNKWVHQTASSGVSEDHYGRGAITFNEPDETTSMYANFCKSCHTNFHGTVAGSEIGGSGTPPEEFQRHPAGGVQIGGIGGGHSRLSRLVGMGANQTQVMSPDGIKAGSYTASHTNLTPSCMSCHKGHGNQNAFGLIFMLGSGTINEQGDAGQDMRNTCRQCHGQGGSSTSF